MAAPDPELVAADLARLVSPGLRSPRTRLVALPCLLAVQAERDRGALDADAIEAVVNRGLAVMAAGSHDEGLPRLAAADRYGR